MNLTINGKVVKTQTWVLLGLIASGAAASQIAAVNHFLSYHPHLAPLGEFLLAAIALLHNPAVEQFIFQQSSTQPDGTEVQTKITAPTPVEPK
jgi:hypothetical protein